MERGQIPDDAIARGAYVYSDSEVAPDLTLIGTGSEVSLCVEAAETLREEGVSVRVVSMPSTSRFAQQDKEYRDKILIPGVGKRLSVEAGSTMGWNRWVGDTGDAHGLDHFGASAPGPELAERFGFTPEAVAAHARELLAA